MIPAGTKHFLAGIKWRIIVGLLFNPELTNPQDFTS